MRREMLGRETRRSSTRRFQRVTVAEASLNAAHDLVRLLRQTEREDLLSLA